MLMGLRSSNPRTSLFLGIGISTTENFKQPWRDPRFRLTLQPQSSDRTMSIIECKYNNIEKLDLVVNMIKQVKRAPVNFRCRLHELLHVYPLKIPEFINLRPGPRWNNRHRRHQNIMMAYARNRILRKYFDWSMQDHTISRYDVLIGDEI
jgi:hypothetical protein